MTEYRHDRRTHLFGHATNGQHWEDSRKKKFGCTNPGSQVAEATFCTVLAQCLWVQGVEVASCQLFWRLQFWGGYLFFVKSGYSVRTTCYSKSGHSVRATCYSKSGHSVRATCYSKSGHSVRATQNATQNVAHKNSVKIKRNLSKINPPINNRALSKSMDLCNAGE
jgi:hypothetical protein